MGLGFGGFAFSPVVVKSRSRSAKVGWLWLAVGWKEAHGNWPELAQSA